MARRVSSAKREQNKKISEKIEVLRREGKDARQAAGAAYGMLKEGRLGRHGVYHRAGRKRRRGSGRS
jgi:hypothetical protein